MSVTLAEYSSRLRGAATQMQDLVAAELRATGLSAQSAARSVAPRRTGALINSIALDVGSGSTGQLRLGSPLAYADVQERLHGFLSRGMQSGSAGLPDRLLTRVRALVVSCGQ